MAGSSSDDKSKGAQIYSVDTTASGGLWVGAGSLAQKLAWLVSWDGGFLKKLLKDNSLAYLAFVQQLYLLQ